ncbi:hypothetical protein D3C72_2173150 [compost metagenome]
MDAAPIHRGAGAEAGDGLEVRRRGNSDAFGLGRFDDRLGDRVFRPGFDGRDECEHVAALKAG